MNEKLGPCPFDISAYAKRCMFRANRISDGKITRGYLVIEQRITIPFPSSPLYHIVQFGSFNGMPTKIDDLVDPDTIKMWTGEVDECGNSIYEPFPDVLNRRTESAANKSLTLGFDVVDTQSGKYPDLHEIALKEDWAKGLAYCDMEGFVIGEDGALILMDECGNFVYTPAGRFRVIGPEALTCEGCTYQPDFPSHAKCHGCARSHTDHYRRPPEGGEK